MKLATGHKFVMAAKGLAAVMAIAAGAVLSAGTTAAGATNWAPVDQSGPALAVSTDALQASLSCNSVYTSDAATASFSRDPILLVPGTDLDPNSNYSWNYERGFDQLQWPWCSVTLPYQTTGDVSVAGEYLVNAIRTLNAQSAQKVDILGYSQGGMVPRWALRFWPDTRGMVGSYVALDPSNHGTLDSDYCALGVAKCPPAYWQQASTAQFIQALNSYTETFSGIDYTVVYSRTDEIVVPNEDVASSSSLTACLGCNVRNISVQSICPNDPSEHLLMGSTDPVGYALAIDAFSHEALADASHVAPTVCAEGLSPAVDPTTFPTDFARFLGAIGNASQNAPQTSSEPVLPGYVYAN